MKTLLYGAVRHFRAAVGVNSLRPLVAILCGWFSFTHATMGTAAVIRPDLYENAAYELAEYVLPIRAWGTIMVLNALLLGWAAIMRRSIAARWGLVVYSTIQWVFAISIFWLTFDSSLGAFAGSVQWLTGFVAAMIVLFGPVTTTGRNAQAERRAQ